MRKHELKVINALLALGHASLPPRQALREMVSSLAATTRADRVALYLACRSGGRYVLGGESLPAGATPSPPSLAGDSPLARLAEEMSKPSIGEGPTGATPAWDAHQAWVLVPVSCRHGRGMLALLAGDPRAFANFSLTFWEALADTLRLALEDLSLGETVRVRFDELRLLQGIGGAAYATLDLDTLLPSLVKRLSEELDLEACRVVVEGPGLPVKASWPEHSPHTAGLEGLVRRVLDEGNPEIDLPWPTGGDGDACWATAFPLTFRGQRVGAAVLVGKHPLSGGDEPLFDDDKRPFVEALAVELSMSMSNALSFAEATHLAAENEHRARELSVLFETSRVLAGTMRLDDVLRIILTAATYGHGLGFNRAALFLLNDKTETLQGMMGVGPDSADEASRVWSDLGAHHLPLGEALRQSLTSHSRNAFDGAVRAVRVRVRPEAGILALTALEQRPFNVPDSWSDPRVNRSVADRLGSRAFATAPLMAEDRVLGVIAVDNLFNGRTITEKDVQLLSTFANQAALAIKSAQLLTRLERANQELRSTYRRLSRSERLAALGEMAATVAHEVRNPLVSVGGFARRLENRLRPGDPNRRYTGIILKEIERLEGFVNETLLFSREIPQARVEVDLNALVREMADFFGDDLREKEVSLTMSLEEGLPTLLADPGQLSQVLVNLFSNSLDVLPAGGGIRLSTESVPARASVRLSFADTGGGIPADQAHQLFHPFFTTKRRGTGLGLPIVQKIVSSHGGTVEVDNRPGESITFLITLPLRQEGTS